MFVNMSKKQRTLSPELVQSTEKAPHDITKAQMWQMLRQQSERQSTEMVNFAVRVPKSLADAIRRAPMDFAKKKTVQEIATEAFTMWLHNHEEQKERGQLF